MPAVYNVPRRNKIFRIFGRLVFRGLFYLLGRVDISGIENVPKNGAYLIVVNHVSLFDAPLLIAFWPMAPEAAGAADLWNRPGISVLARLYGGIPVHRGRFDRQLMDQVNLVLQSGKPLLIAPEGGRSHALGMRRAKPGVAYIMEKTDVTVIPVGMIGATDDFLAQALRGRRPEIKMIVGTPFHLPPVEGKGEMRRNSRQRNADMIMGHIAELLPHEYRGVYADHVSSSD
jgi:1-acyl-sn-glycerol-3-phosphate acyltransferase